MQFFTKKAKSKGRVGLSVNSDRLAFVHMEVKDGIPHLLNCERIDLESEKEAGPALNKLVKELELEGTQCSYVLNPKDYNLHLVEAPNVEAEELRQAVRWKIKDLLDMKIEDAAIDVFQVPEDAYRGREMVYVVAALNSKIQNIVKLITDSGLELAVIDIPELVMKNIATRFIDDDNGVAFMDLRKTGSTMNISRNGDLYLTRRINTQIDPDVMQSSEWNDLKDRLILEIQRSLDYYESQMGKGQITKIVISQRQHDSQAMVESLDQMLAAKVSVFNFEDAIEFDTEVSSEDLQICMAPIGACLRGAKKPETVADPEPTEPPEDTEQEAA
ncbi:MAG: hypothetical protein GKR91_09710 [Pseudomonadales bacterium]|nr:hypothetical protein [Pseudomonadales bacterium]